MLISLGTSVRFSIFFYIIFGCSRVCFAGIFTDFSSGMAPSTSLDQNFVDENPVWQLGIKIYNDFIENMHISEQIKIPKIFHHIWLGGSLPEFCARLRESWFDFNPDWQGVLWTDNEVNYKYGYVVTSLDELQQVLHEKKIQRIVFDVRNFLFKNQYAYEVTQNYGERSDIVRYEVLFRFGGLYIDTDFECLKPFDFFHYTCDFYSGIGYSKTYGLLNGLMASAPGDAIVGLCIDDLIAKNPEGETWSIIGRTGPGLLTRSFVKAIRSGYQGVAVAFPVTTFYPWPSWDRFHVTQEKVQSWIRPESYGVHYWMTSWQKNNNK